MDNPRKKEFLDALFRDERYEEVKEALRARLTDRFGAELEFQFEVDASLIGGVYLRVGDQVIDGTVAGKLAALRDRLTT